MDDREPVPGQEDEMDFDVKLLPIPSERELLVITFPPEAFDPHCQDALGDILNAWARENNIMGRMIVMPQNMTINIVDEATMAELGWRRIPVANHEESTDAQS